MKIVSACLIGVACRYDGKSFPSDYAIELAKKGLAIPVCPEQLGGLPTPRNSAEIVEGRVKDKNGKDYTQAFELGAKEALKIAELMNVDEAILKSNSPSCGCGRIYDGTFSGKLKEGNGIFTQLLLDKGIKVRSE